MCLIRKHGQGHVKRGTKELGKSVVLGILTGRRGVASEQANERARARETGTGSIFS